MLYRLTRHKISCREADAVSTEGKTWMANTDGVNVRLARGQLHRLVRPLCGLHVWRVKLRCTIAENKLRGRRVRPTGDRICDGRRAHR